MTEGRPRSRHFALRPPLDYGATVVLRGYHLPGLQGAVATETQRCGTVEIELPRLEPAALGAALQAAQVAAAGLRARSVDEIFAVSDQVIANWLRPDDPWRQRAEVALPAVTGFSPATIRHGLPRLLAPLRAAALRALFDEELGDHRRLDLVRAGRRAVGPRLITHVMSGNIPGLSAAPILLSLALKSAVLVKSATNDPLFPALLAASIADVDVELSRCVAVAHWRGGQRPLEEVAFGSADVVVASGSDASIAAIGSRVPGRFIGHGHKVSFAVIGREHLGDRQAVQHLANRLAYDVSLWDQQGCLSPQLCYLEAGGRVGAAEFADVLAESLAAYARQLPPRRLSFEEQADVLRFRQEAEWRQGVRLHASADSTAWSISVEPDDAFVPTCLNRCVRLKSIADLSQLPAVLSAHRRHLEAAGLAAGLAVDAARSAMLAEMLSLCGVHRISPIGSMQAPRLSWPQSGRPRVAEWVEWAEVDASGRHLGEW